MNVVLLTEDNETDVRLIKRIFDGGSVALHCVNSGEDCLMYLRHEGPYFDDPSPDLVLLDLSLPMMDGRDVLRHVKADPALRYIPIVILTGYADAHDVVRQYDAGCNAYVVKPHDYDALAATLRAIVAFWFNVAVLPGRPN